MKNNKTIYLSFCLIIIFSIAYYYYLNQEKRIAKKLYLERTYLINEFSYTSILNRSDYFYQLSYYNDKHVNTFYIEKHNDIFTFTDDSIQYNLKNIKVLSYIDIKNNMEYKKSLTNELSRLLTILNELNIKSVSAEFNSIGIDMKIYLGNNKALLFVKDISTVKNVNWKNYITSGTVFDKNWYFVEDK